MRDIRTRRQTEHERHRIHKTAHGKMIGVRPPGTPTNQRTTSVLTGLWEFTFVVTTRNRRDGCLKGESVKLTVLKGISAYSMADRQPEIVVNSPFGKYS